MTLETLYYLKIVLIIDFKNWRLIWSAWTLEVCWRLEITGIVRTKDFRRRSDNWNCLQNWCLVLSKNWKCPDKWTRRPPINWIFQTKMTSQAIDWACLDTWFRVTYVNWTCRGSCFGRPSNILESVRKNGFASNLLFIWKDPDPDNRVLTIVGSVGWELPATCRATVAFWSVDFKTTFW